ncbi:serum paraoxonase/arylesterase 2-like [Mercenaria mercenaria]|uniref:serum paraoxonase/arylesterase 2-like n=1 Tax=Mercenaria mercenaria TaxID=6596 RepID=UPI00234E4FE7|nr:serum paraoxonase/arylesterase 2-like [Mercenaria mercenaria]
MQQFNVRSVDQAKHINRKLRYQKEEAWIEYFAQKQLARTAKQKRIPVAQLEEAPQPPTSEDLCDKCSIKIKLIKVQSRRIELLDQQKTDFKQRSEEGFKIFTEKQNLKHICIGDTSDGKGQEVFATDDMIKAGDGFSFDKITGDVSAIGVNGTPGMFTLNKTNVQSTSSILSSPLGLSTWRDPKTGRLYVYVITHPATGDVVQVFEVEMPIKLSYIKSITDPSFTFMNNLVVVGMDKFYITKYTMYNDLLRIQLEHLSHLRNGKVLFYDGQKAIVVSSGHFLPNGINISPDQKMIYVAELGGKKLNGFRRESNNNLVLTWHVEMDTAPDNINVDENGDLWIGCHPVLWKLLDFYGIFGALQPSQVIRVKMRNHTVSSIEEIYMDDGNECTASTVAVFAYGKLVIGTLFKQTVVCDIKYLSD